MNRLLDEGDGEAGGLQTARRTYVLISMQLSPGTLFESKLATMSDASQNRNGKVPLRKSNRRDLYHTP